MTSTTLAQLEGLITEFLGSASSIASKVADGKAELQTVEAEVSTLIETVLANAKSARDSLKAQADKVEDQVETGLVQDAAKVAETVTEREHEVDPVTGMPVAQ